MKIAASVMCFDRPHYLEPAIRSFEQADEANEIDWYFFQDGAVNQFSEVRYTTDEKIVQVTNMINASSLNAQIMKQEYNVSPAIQRVLMYRLLEDYDLVFVFDDDMVIGKHYLSLLRKMANQFPKHTGILYTNASKPPTEENLKKVYEYVIARLWGHYMWRDNWLKFKKDHDIYHDFLIDKDFFIFRRHGPFNEVPKEVPHISDDKVVNKLCRRYGIRKLVPYVSRAKYIGKFGTLAYKSDKYWRKKNMHVQPDKITFPSDEKLKKFARGKG